MARKYILNKTGSVLMLQDSKLQTLVKLQPKQCSLQSFDEVELLSNPYVCKTYQNGFIDLVDERVEIVTKKVAKNYGQKYLIGTKAFLNDKNNLDIEVESYDPSTELYTVRIIRTSGVITVQEKSITLKRNIGDKINVDIDENGDLTDVQDISTHRDLSLPQQPEQVQIVRTQDQSVNRAVNAKQLIDDANNISEKIASQKVDIVYGEAKQEKVDDEETFIVKAKDGKFAKEISASEMVENTQKAINESLQDVIDSTVVAKEPEEEFDTTAFVSLPKEMQTYLNGFLSKDARGKKMVITRLKDVAKLQAIAKFGDELSKKAALAKLEKLGN